MLRFATLRDFVGGDRAEPSAVMGRVARALRDLETTATVRFLVVDAKPSVFTLRVGGKRADVKTGGQGDDFDLEVITRAESLVAMFSGSVSPIEAFLRGHMRLRGDVEVARRLYRRLAESQEAQFDICRTGGISWPRRGAGRRASRSSRRTT